MILAALLIMPAAPLLAQARTGRVMIQVHLIEARTDRPVKDAVVGVGSPPLYHGTSFAFERRTDETGTAMFAIPYPVPDELDILAGMGGGHWHGCSSPAYCTADILEHGLVGVNLCWPAWHKHKPQPKFTPKPGEVYIFGHHISGWALGWGEALGLVFSPDVQVPASAYHPKCPPVAPLLKKMRAQQKASSPPGKDERRP